MARPIERQQPPIEDGDAIGDALGFVEVVGRHQNRAAGGAAVLEQPSDAAPDLGIEPGCRLVEQQHRRIVQERARERDLLTGALRKLRRRRRRAIGQTEEHERGVDRALGIADLVERA